MATISWSSGSVPARSTPSTVIAVLASCGLAVSLTQTIVVPMLPRLPQLLNASTTTVGWLVTATLVAGAVSAPLLGRLGDMRGKRRMLLIALGMVTAGSVVGALAPNVWVLMLGRTLQGASLGVIALGISIMRDVLPPGRVGSGVALMSSSLGIGGAIALPLTGLVAEHMSWRWLFAGAAVIGLLQVVLVQRAVPESESRTGGRFDLPGAIGLAIALVGILLAISKGAEWGWTSPQVLILVGTSAVTFGLWGRYQLRRESPLVDLRISARPAVLWTNVASILVGFSMFAGFLVTTQILQAGLDTGYGFGLSLMGAGLALLPIGLTMTVFSQVSARISRWRGPRATLVTGTVILAAGNVAMAAHPASIPLVITAAAVSSIGASLAYSALPLLIMGSVPTTETAAANSLNTLMRMLGTSTCSAFVAAVVTGITTTASGHVVPSPTAFTVIFLAAAGAAVLGGALAAVTPRVEVPASPAGVAPERVGGRHLDQDDPRPVGVCKPQLP